MKLLKIKKPSGLFILVFTLAVLAGALLTWRVFLAPSKTPQPLIIPTPVPESKFSLASPTPSLAEAKEGKGDSPQELTKALKEKFPLIESVPYETEIFSVDYLAPLKLEVKIKIATDQSTIKKEVSDWIWSKGVNPGTHQIEWLTPVP